MVSENIALGNAGSIELGFSAGKGSVTYVVADANSGTAANVAITQDATPLVKMLFSLIEKISPAGLVAIEETAKAAIIANLANLG